MSSSTLRCLSYRIAIKMQAFLQFFFNRLFVGLLKKMGTFFVKMKKIQFKISTHFIFIYIMFLDVYFYDIDKNFLILSIISDSSSFKHINYSIDWISDKYLSTSNHFSFFIIYMWTKIVVNLGFNDTSI